MLTRPRPLASAQVAVAWDTPDAHNRANLWELEPLGKDGQKRKGGTNAGGAKKRKL
jgi:hypothetical protein